MYKKTITYNDFDGNQRIEDAYFNLTKTELIEFALELPDNVSDSIKTETGEMDEKQAVNKIMNSFNSKSIFKFIKDLILKSYGVRKNEGKTFAKFDEDGRPLSLAFSQTMAFETIMSEFMENDIEAANFVNAVIPSQVADKMPNVQAIRQGAATN